MGKMRRAKCDTLYMGSNSHTTSSPSSSTAGKARNCRCGRTSWIRGAVSFTLRITEDEGALFMAPRERAALGVLERDKAESQAGEEQC